MLPFRLKAGLRATSYACSVVLLLSIAVTVLGDDWPQWRGPTRDGVWRETGIVERFASDQLACRWQRPIGPGYCGPTIAGGRVYVMDRVTEPRQQERVVCLDADTGDRIWEDLTATPPARWSNIHFVRNGDRIWMFNERGELIIARLSPQGFQEISRTRVLEPTTDQLPRRDGVCWSHPGFANRHIFARNDRQIICSSLEGVE